MSRDSSKPSAAAASPKALSGRVTASPVGRRHGIVALLTGVFFAVCLLKFGNPPIMEKWVASPENIYELILGNPWPLNWGYKAAVLLLIVAFFQARWRLSPLQGVPVVLALLPGFWLSWQLVAAAHTLDSSLTGITLVHLCLCVAFFYAGLIFLGKAGHVPGFWVALFAGYLLMEASALQQRLGGLEETRNYFNTYIYPTLTEFPAEYIKKINSNRVFGTLFYPNALAAGLILLFPPLTVMCYRWTGGGRFTPSARGFLLGLWSTLTALCLFWSGSKAGWLVMMVMVLIAFLNWPSVLRKWRIVVALAVLAAGLSGFFYTYSAFFRRGAPSVGARFDYWRAALKNVEQRPLYGSGQGTFAIPYKELKAPEAEMSRMVHNDYLQQASDSGIPGLLTYVALVGGGLAFGYKRSRLRLGADPGGVDDSTLLPFAVWLGLAGWFLHGFVDFNLYIPALAWIAFTLLGWLLGRGIATEPQKAL